MKRNTLFITCFFLFFLVLPVSRGLADSGPPPAILWLRFDYQNMENIDLEGVQIIGCRAASCNDPVLLQQYGVCTESGCLQGEPLFDIGKYTLDCTQNRCRADSGLYREGGDQDEAHYLRLIIQFPDRTRQSGSFENPFLKGYNWNNNLLVRIEETGADVMENPEPLPTIYKLPEQYGLAFLLTLFIETFVAGIFFIIHFKPSILTLFKNVLMIVVINSVTFPVVWFFFPAWQPFVSSQAKILGVTILLAVSIYALLWYFVFSAPSIDRKISWIAALVFFLLVMIFACFELFLWFAYQHYPVASAKGLPYPVVLFLAELFAIVAEAALLVLYGKLPLKISSWLSLAMNMASFITGLAVFHNWYF